MQRLTNTAQAIDMAALCGLAGAPRLSLMREVGENENETRRIEDRRRRAFVAAYGKDQDETKEED
jgi:hypothetical protein